MHRGYSSWDLTQLISESGTSSGGSLSYCSQSTCSDCRNQAISVSAGFFVNHPVGSAATTASSSLLALPHSFRAAGLTDEQLVYGCPTVLARVLAPAASRRLL